MEHGYQIVPLIFEERFLTLSYHHHQLPVVSQLGLRPQEYTYFKDNNDRRNGRVYQIDEQDEGFLKRKQKI